MENKTIKNLLIIGNGFDLSLGMKIPKDCIGVNDTYHKYKYHCCQSCQNKMYRMVI